MITPYSTGYYKNVSILIFILYGYRNSFKDVY